MEPKNPHKPDEAVAPPDLLAQAPRHGFQGDRGAAPSPPGVPAALCVALSREAGARGGSIGRRVGRLLGWQVYDKEVLEYVAQEATVRQDVLRNQGDDAARWSEERVQALLREGRLSGEPSVAHLARVILALGAVGQVVFVGRGAGCLLPPASTLNVRIVAPLPDRVAYLGQWLRLTAEEAAERVRLRDRRRADFLATHFDRRPDEIYPYDLVLNSGLLGEELAADLIVQAARAKQALLHEEGPA